jgi:methylmalonyl-CoA mutase
MRSTEAEKSRQIDNLRSFQARNENTSSVALSRLKEVARNEANVFAELMESVKVCSLGQITDALFDVGGQYRRSM